MYWLLSCESMGTGVNDQNYKKNGRAVVVLIANTHCSMMFCKTGMVGSDRSTFAEYRLVPSKKRGREHEKHTKQG